ncbi:hypothetical protein WJX72_011137 [[Myrmecia] bisecta]|uniref:Uncharacterized protein n=1 Tax=[Myrmecia] bisecta TaxID=41462 RepID=A0AAW1P0I4_9CHLO
MDRLHTDPQQAALLAVANLIGRRLAAPAVPEPRHKPQDQAVPADPRTSRQTRVREMMSRVLRLSDRIASLSSTQHPRLLPHSPQQDKTSIRRRDQPLVMRSLPALPITAHLSPARSRRAPSPSGDSQEGSLRSLQSSWVTQSSLLGSERSFSGSEQSLRGPLAAQENLQHFCLEDGWFGSHSKDSFDEPIGALLDGTQPAFQASDATRKLDPEAVLSRSVTGTVLISASLGAATALQPAAEATGAPKRPTNRQETPMRSSMEHSVVHSLAIPEQLDASFAGEETHAQAVRGAHSLAASVAASSLGPASAEYESDFEADASLVQSMRHSMQRSVDRSMEIPEQLDASFAASVVMEIADESRDDTMAKEAPTLPLNPTVASGHELPPALRLRLIADELQWLSPAGLEAALQEEMQRLEEVHAMQVELDHMQHARALAAVHSEAERLAAAVDAQMTTEAQATRLQQLQEEQEGQLKAVTKGLKEQLRTEGLAHLRDLAATLRQELASGLGPAHPAANASMSDDAIEEERDVTSSIDDIIEEEDIVLEEQNFPLKDARVVGRMGGFTAGAQGVAKPQTGRYTAAAAASLASGGASSASSVLEEVAMWSAQGLPAGEPNQDTSYLARQFLADARRRLQEVDSAVQQALQQARATAQAKQAQLQAAVATAATDKQRRSAARGQKLLTMQLAMDTAELQRQLATARADFERQRLCWEQIRRSASDLGSATTTPIRSDHQTDHAGDLPSAQAQLAGADMLDSHAVAARLLAAQPQAELRAESSRDSMSAPGVSEADDLRLSSAAQSVSEVQYSEDFESTFDSPRSRQPVAWRPGRVESGELFDDSELDAQSAELEAAQQGLARLLAEKHKALQRQRREAALAAKSAAVAQMAASISSIDAEIEALKAGAAASLQPPVGPPGMAALTAIVPHPQHAAGSAELDIRGERSAATSVVEEELPSRRSQDVVLREQLAYETDETASSVSGSDDDESRLPDALTTPRVPLTRPAPPGVPVLLLSPENLKGARAAQRLQKASTEPP